jgi:hypothetical protein
MCFDNFEERPDLTFMAEMTRMKRWRTSAVERERLLANVRTLKHVPVTSSFATTDAESSVMECGSITGRV